jgi:hypothetical protein
MDTIAGNNHTVDALRTLSKAALALCYSDAQITVIQAKIVRQPIPEEVIDRMIKRAGSTCCFCADGVTVRPYQIHHIEPYSKTQDHSEENLVLVCPNHHTWIHEVKVPTLQQKHARRGWQSLVALAERYKEAGLSFPFGSYVAVDYVGQPSAGELIHEIRIAPPTAISVSNHTVADTVLENLLRERFALLLGHSGDGKSTLAIGVTGRLAQQGWQIFRYRPPVGDNRLAITEILSFIDIAVRDSVLILDDVNAWMSTQDLEEVAAAVTEKAAVVATWTRALGGDDTRIEIHFPKWIGIEWSTLAPSVMEFLSANETEVVEALRTLQSPNDVRPIGLGMFDDSLGHRMRRYVQDSKTVAEFLFLLRGGSDVVRRELIDLADTDRADLPVLYAAVEQIADFERAVTSIEVAMRLGQLNVAPSLPAPTPEWIRNIYELERRRRRIQRRRDAYTTIHREWAKRLICAALGEQKTSEGIKALLARDFNPHTPTPFRTMRLWSWLWYDDHGNPFIKKWAASLTTDNWIAFVRTATAQGLHEVGFIAEQMHLLFPNQKWTQIVADVFGAISGPLISAVSAATAESWGALRSLFMTLGHACPSIAAQIIRGWPPATAAKVLEQTHPDYYDSISWFVSGVKDYCPEWVAELGRQINWGSLQESLKQVRAGDLAAIESCHDILHRTGVPLTRSRLRQFVDIMCNCLSDSSLTDLHVGLGIYMSIVLGFYPKEAERLAASLDINRLAQDLSSSHPKQWRSVSDLYHFIPQNHTDVFERIIDNLDQDAFVATVSRYGPLCPYELRCLIWFVARAAKGDARKGLATRLAETVKEACTASTSEREHLLNAMTTLDSQTARAIACQLPLLPTAKSSTLSDSQEDDDEQRECDKEVQRLIREAEASGDDYDVDAIFAFDS